MLPHRIILFAGLLWLTGLPLAGQQPDSVKKKTIVTPGLFEYHPLNLNTGRDSIGLPEPESASILDPEWRAGGFSYNIGQFFKPFRSVRYGIHDQWDVHQPFLTDPLTSRPDPYAVDNRHGIRFLDTRTPYANVQFTQGKQKLQLLDVTASQNISPYINVTAGFRRRQHIGAYLNNTTDHYNIWLSVNAHTRNQRAWLFASGWFNQISDQMNGGVSQDGGLPFEALFNKNAQRVNLTDLRWRRFSKGISIMPTYRIPVTSGFLEIGLHSAATEWLRRINSSAFFTTANTYPVPISPGTDSSAIEDKSGIFSLQNTLQLRLDITPLPGWNLQTRTEAGYFHEKVSFGSLRVLQRRPVAQLDAALTSENTYIGAHASFSRPSLYLKPDLLFSLEGRHQVLKTPRTGLLILGSLASRSALPSLQQWYAEALNAAASIRVADAGVQWKLFRRDTNIMRLSTSLKGFYSHQQNVPLCDSLGMWWQYSGVVQDLGLVHDLEYRIGVWSVRHTLTVHLPTTPENAPYHYRGWASSFPALHGRGGLFLTVKDKHWVKWLEAGGEINWFTQYTPPALDVRTGDLFYQNWADAPAFGRIDGVMRFQVRRAVVHFRFTNLLEGLLLPGNYLLPFYPAQERALYFGVNWTFFD